MATSLASYRGRNWTDRLSAFASLLLCDSGAHNNLELFLIGMTPCLLEIDRTRGSSVQPPARLMTQLIRKASSICPRALSISGRNVVVPIGNDAISPRGAMTKM
jgi:hypothetical protein